MDIVQHSTDKYDQFCLQHADKIPVFFQPWWLEALAGCGKVEKLIFQTKSGEVFGIWPVFQKQKYGFRWNTLPPYTPVSGPWLISAPENAPALIKSVAARFPWVLYFLTHSFQGLSFRNAWESAGFETELRYTYQLPRVKEAEDLYHLFQPNTRSRIRKAAQLLEVRAEQNLDRFLPLYIRHAKERNIFTNQHLSAFKALFEAGLTQNQGALWCAYDRQDTLVAGIFAVWDQQQMYILVTSMDRDFREYQAPRLLLWHAIQQAVKQGLAFDFEGGNVPGIGSFFASFGATKTPYLRAMRYGNKIWRRVVKRAELLKNSVPPSAT
ncbi:MAG: GNAT family N-acetyltransferase [Bacteroidota bacterium]